MKIIDFVTDMAIILALIVVGGYIMDILTGVF